MEEIGTFALRIDHDKYQSLKLKMSEQVVKKLPYS